MPERNRSGFDKVGLGLALVLAIIAGVGLYLSASTQQAEYQVEAENQARDHASIARIEANYPCSRPHVADPQGCVDEAEKRARPQQRDEYDLEAQRTMAVWTRAMGVAAIIGMGVGIFGLGLIFVTFRETRRSADEAHRAANEAERTRLSYVERERGHLKFKYGEAFRHKGELSCYFNFKNIGPSLAQIDGFSVDIFDDPVWPSSLSEPSTGLQMPRKTIFLHARRSLASSRLFGIVDLAHSKGLVIVYFANTPPKGASAWC